MDDLISEFITETSESLAVLDMELVKLEQNPDDAAILGNIFRIMHTIKGTCGFLGLPRLEHVAHAGENVLGKIRDHVLAATPDAVTLILESLDRIKELLEYLSANGQEQEGDDSALIAKLDHFSETGQLLGAALVASPAPVVSANPFPHFRGEDELEVAAAKEKEKAQGVSKEDAAREMEAMLAAMEEKPATVVAVQTSTPPAPKVAPKVEKPTAKAEAGEEGKEAAGAQQSIRVNIDVLENLMQMVSELVLTRNQLMQIARTKQDKESHLSL